VVRSQQNVTNSSKTTEAANTVSVQNNLPNADAGTNNAGSQEQRQEETTNYEIAKTVRTIVRDQPKVARLSLAVMVDGTTIVGADGKPNWQERKPEEIERIVRLVRSAIGFDEKRGDKVEVVSLRFTTEPDAPEAALVGGLPLGIEKSDLMRLAQLIVFGAIGTIALLLVLRPMVHRLTLTPPAAALPGMEGMTDDAMAIIGGASRDLGQLGGPPMRQALPGPHGQFPALTGPNNAAAQALEDESMVNIANVEGQLRASSIRRLADLVEKHPEESLSIMRAWMQQEPA
jgi:flagellar M-ring protein FliF